MIVKDFLGFEWRVEAADLCKAGILVQRGRKIGIRGGAAVIITPALYEYVTQHNYATALDKLQIGGGTLKRIYKDIDKNGAWPVRDLTDPERKYNPPVCKRGDIVRDIIAGDVVVGGFTDGAWPWIYRKDTGTPILCGDLVLAVKTESAKDVMAMYGVNAVTVSKWRRVLGVTAANNAGTSALYHELAKVKLTPEVTAKGLEAAMRPEAREKIRLKKMGVAAHPNTRAALKEAAMQPKTEIWKDRRRKKPLYLKPNGKIDWSKIDWSLKNKVIMHEFQASAPMVSMMRKKHAPDTIRPKKKNNTAQ